MKVLSLAWLVPVLSGGNIFNPTNYFNSLRERGANNEFLNSCLSRHEDTSDLVCAFIERDSAAQGLDPMEVSLFKDILGATTIADTHIPYPCKLQYLDSFLPDDPETSVRYPYCSWRYQYSQLSSETSAWNVAFPDKNSVYQAMMVYFNPNDEFVMNGPSLPYVRYFSLQTYDNVAASVDAVRDYQVRTEFMSNSNVYMNSTAGETGEPNGAFDLRITAHGSKYDDNGFINELAALPATKRSGFFFLFLRFYDPEPFPQSSDTFKNKMGPVMDECYGSHLSESDSMSQAKKWGWVCPPALKRTNTNGGLMQVLPYCIHGRDDNFKDYDQGIEPGKDCMLEPNSNNNLFLPANSKMDGEFRNRDATYLFGCAEQVTNTGKLRGGGKGGMWARLTGTLPRTTTSLYTSPFVGEPDNYDVRYISISSINRSPPSAVFETFMDEDILLHNEKVGKVGEDGEVDRTYVIWYGPDEEDMPEAAQLEGGMYMPWPREVKEDEDGTISYGDLNPFPGILYREVLSQSQVLGEDAEYKHGVCDIVRDSCWQGEEAKEGDGEGVVAFKRKLFDDCDEKLCCGNSPPACCRGRSHIQATMREHYPSIAYYMVDEDGIREM